METPLFILANGTAAVAIFFVLSGYVLSLGFFNNNQKEVTATVIKRWPRLVPIALISVLFSYACIKLNFYHYLKAAEITHSDWMKHFGYAGHDNIEDATLLQTIYQGVFLVFFRGNGDSWLNSSLWTMHLELVGSLIVYGLVAITRKSESVETFCVYLIAGIATYFSNPYLPLFVAGSFLAYQHSRGFAQRSFSTIWKIVITIFVILSFGYMSPGVGFYRITSHLNPYEADFRIFTHGLAALFLIHLAITNIRLKKGLDQRWLKLLGHASFPLYAIHVPVFFSLSSWIFIASYESFGYRSAFFITFIVTITVVLLASHALGKVDRTWCRFLNSLQLKTQKSHSKTKSDQHLPASQELPSR